MTYETFDNFLTLVLSGTIYGGALWFVAAFTVFVASHELHRSEQEIVVEAEIQPPLDNNEATNDDVEETPIADNSGASQVAIEITEEPIDFSRWKVADLRSSKLREALSIPLREGKRLYRKAELIAFYQQAITV